MRAADIKCLDSSAWLAYYFGENNDVKQIIEEGSLVITSSLSLFEIKKRLATLKKDFELFIDFVKKRSVIVAPGILIAEKAADIAFDKKLGAVDSLIYATSLISNAELITGDNDFRNLEKVKIV